LSVGPQLIQQQLWAFDNDDSIGGLGDGTDNLTADKSGDWDRLGSDWDSQDLTIDSHLDGGGSDWDNLNNRPFQVSLDDLGTSGQWSNDNSEPVVLGTVSGQEVVAWTGGWQDQGGVIKGHDLLVKGRAGNGARLADWRAIDDLVDTQVNVVPDGLEWEEESEWVLDVNALENNLLGGPDNGQIKAGSQLHELDHGGGVELLEGQIGNGSGWDDGGLSWDIVWPQQSLDVGQTSFFHQDGSLGNVDVFRLDKDLVQSGSLEANLFTDWSGEGNLSALGDEPLALLGLGGSGAQCLLLWAGLGDASGQDLGLLAAVAAESNHVVKVKVDKGGADFFNVPHGQDWSGQTTGNANLLDQALSG